MPRSRIEIGGAIDTWIRELPNLGRAREMRDDWAEAMHLMLLSSREHTHVITGQLRGTQYSTTQLRGEWQVEGRILYPARNPRGERHHYAIYEFKRKDSGHDAPAAAFRDTYPVFAEAIGSGLERQVRGWA